MRKFLMSIRNSQECIFEFFLNPLSPALTSGRPPKTYIGSQSILYSTLPN